MAKNARRRVSIVIVITHIGARSSMTTLRSRQTSLARIYHQYQ